MDLNKSQQRADELRAFDEQGIDVTETSPLPDIPDAGPDSRPLIPPQPVDISTSTLNADAALVAGTFDEGEGRTLYEQALDAYEESAAAETTETTAATPQRRITDRRARVYDIS